MIPPDFPIPTRRELVEQHKRFRQIYNPAIDLADGGEPDIDAKVAADTALPQIANARRNTQAAFVTSATGEEDIAWWGEVEGVPRAEATGSLGLVRITASIGGVEIQEGEALTIKGLSNSPRFKCRDTRRYFDGGYVPIVAIDVGQETNLEPGTVLEWYHAPPGLGQRAIVVDQDGEGFVGGRNAASPEEWKAAILQKLQDPPGAENDADYRREARRSGVPVQQAFTYPAIWGPGTTAVTFSVFPERKGGTRAPTEQQLRAVGEYLELRFGADDGILMAANIEEPVTVAFRLDWTGGGGWSSAAPWPLYGAPGSGATTVTSVTDALTFSVDGSVVAPTAGKRIALYDRNNARFVEKRIATVSGSGPWDITVDTTNRASDESYTPVVGQRVSPWSEHLNKIVDATLPVFAQLGPGEMVGPDLFGNILDGLRRKRTPFAPASWPSILTQDALESAVSPRQLAEVFDRELVEGDGAAPSLGVITTLVHTLSLGDLCCYPKAL